MSRKHPYFYIPINYDAVMFSYETATCVDKDGHIIKIQATDTTRYDENSCIVKVRYWPTTEWTNFYKLMRDIGVSDSLVLRMALRRISDNSDFSQLKKVYHSVQIIRNQKMSEFERMVTIKSPKFERAIGNNNRKTFDFVRCFVNLSGDRETAKDYLKNHSDEILKEVYYKIENCKRFERYGIPISFFKISTITLCCDSSVEYLFELKEVKGLENEKV